MKTGLPCRRASENCEPSNAVPVMAAAAYVWKPSGGTVTFVVLGEETSSCLLSP